MPLPELPSTMPAAVYRERGVLEIAERPLPVLGPRDVLVEVSHCGVCGTDLHLVLEGMGVPGSIGGHEYTGRIAALGGDVTGWAPGDAVVGGPEPACGRCRYCKAARPSLCSGRVGFDPRFQGAFAGYVRVNEGQLLRVPEGLPLRVAALTEPLAVALHAMEVSRVEPAQRALVTGAGPLGLLLVAALRAHGVAEVVVSEPAPRRRERAGRVGATELREPGDLEAPAMPFAAVDDPVDVAFDCSGQPAAVESALAQLRPMGTLVIVGTGLRRPKLDHNRVLMNELVVTGAYCHGAGDLERALALLAGGRLPVDELVEPEDVALPGLAGALERLAAGELAGKVMVAPGSAR